MQGQAMRLASIAVALVLAVVGVTCGWAVVSIRSSVIEMAAATSTLRQYSALQRAVAGEALAEAGYRRVPTPAARARIDIAIADVTAAVTSVQAIGTRKDRAVLSYVTLTNARYTAELLADLDDPRARTEDRVAGPALDSIQNLLDGAIAGRRAEVDAARERQLDLIRTLIIVFPVVIGASLIGLALCWRILVRDQRLLRSLSESHEHLSLHDPLTGLANRRMFAQELALVFEQPVPVATVLFIDLDGFKSVNDRFGHDVGDQLLTIVAQRLTESVRGDLVARLGGDEFAVLLQPAEFPETVADRILAALAVPAELEGHVVNPSGSIGIAVAPTDGAAPRALLRSADEALYLAKAAGKGCWAHPAESADGASLTARAGSAGSSPR